MNQEKIENNLKRKFNLNEDHYYLNCTKKVKAEKKN